MTSGSPRIGGVVDDHVIVELPCRAQDGWETPGGQEGDRIVVAFAGGQQVHPGVRVARHRVLEGDGASEHRHGIRGRPRPELPRDGRATEVKVDEQRLAAELNGEHGEARSQRGLAFAGQG
jgi:hypothetical protein